jgi:OmpA-OmpF porin, OOP family
MNTLLKASMLLTVTFLYGCATEHIKFEPFAAKDLNNKIDAGLYKQKIDNLLIIVDASNSMNGKYAGNGFPVRPSDAAEQATSSPASEADYSPTTSLPLPTKLAVEKELLHRLNQTMPAIDFSSGIRSFGFGPCTDWGFTKLNKSVAPHTTEAFAEGIETLTCANGGSSMQEAIVAAADDLASTTGNIAIIIISDGFRLNESPVSATQALKEQYGDRLCVYALWIGGPEEKSGHFTLQQIADVAGCGFITDVSKIASKTDVGNYILRVFFDRIETVSAPADSDGDGVPDFMDECPNTPQGAKIDKNGCWAYHGVFFDFDKKTIKPEFQSLFENALEVLTINPGLSVEIQGHTDNVGNAEYNQKLSEQRAQAVKDFLVERGIDPSRLTVKGYGMYDPAVSNDTEEGRAFNRRVYFKRTDE